MKLKASVILVRVVHTHLSPGFNHKVSLHNYSGVTASSSVRFTRHNMDDIRNFILKTISKLCSTENNACKSEEATGARSHWVALLLIKSEIH